MDKVSCDSAEPMLCTVHGTHCVVKANLRPWLACQPKPKRPAISKATESRGLRLATYAARRLE
ncbi:MAG: hypothetical protein O3A80_05150, partial [bacterium]|nr:hypothetical protein [bacterium]